MAATTQDLLDLLEPKILGFQDGLTPAGLTPATENIKRKIKFLNEGMHAVWRLLVSIDREDEANFFTTDVALNIAVDLFDANLPADFHEIFLLESTDAPYKKINFTKIGIHQRRFRSDRLSDKVNFPNTEKEVYYAVTRGQPPEIRLARSSPGVNFNVIYRYTLADITLASSSIDDIPAPYRGPITNHAAAAILASVHEPELAGPWAEKWQDDVKSILGSGQQAIDPSMASGSEAFEGLRER